jgi:hypothetical protein
MFLLGHSDKERTSNKSVHAQGNEGAKKHPRQRSEVLGG